MGHRHLLSLLGLTLIILGILEDGWALMTLWLGVDLLVLSFAHFNDWHSVFGKRADGTLPLWSWILFLPLHFYTYLLWHLMRLLSREPNRAAVSEHLVVGRRLLGFEAEGEFANYVDLTAEFAEPSGIRSSSAYHSFPILDGAAPSPEALLAKVCSLRPGLTFVHCAQGHGRTGLFALAILLWTKEAATLSEGLDLLQRVRPGISLSREQLKCVQVAQFLYSYR